MDNLLANAGPIMVGLIDTRCTRGADIARQLRFSAAVCDGIYRLDEHWDGSSQVPERRAISSSAASRPAWR